jgi:hypothetical protein
VLRHLYVCARVHNGPSATLRGLLGRGLAVVDRAYFHGPDRGSAPFPRLVLRSYIFCSWASFPDVAAKKPETFVCQLLTTVVIHALAKRKQAPVAFTETFVNVERLALVSIVPFMVKICHNGRID